MRDGYLDMTGPAPETLNWDSVYRSFRQEKEIWQKDSGRMCAHYVISFHKDEKITPEEVLAFGQEFADKAFPGHQVLLAVHQDRGHLHLHMVANTVSYEDGHKLHTTKKELSDMKEAVNQMCKERELTVAEKGKHFDGSRMEEGEGIAWNQKKYRAMINQKEPSYLVECFQAVMEAREKAVSRDTFIAAMERSGWNVHWSDRRKHITFENKDHRKVRDSNLSRTFTVNINKEALQNEFQHQAEIQQQRELEAYARQLREPVTGPAPEAAVSQDHAAGTREFQSESQNQGIGRPDQPTTQGRVHGRHQRPVRSVKRSHKQDYDFER